MNENNNVIKEEGKSKKTGLIIAIVCIVLAVAGAAYYFMQSSDPKNKVAKALQNTSEEISKQDSLFKVMTGEDSLTKSLENGAEENLGFNFVSSSDYTLSQYSNSGFKVKTALDYKNKKASADLSANINGSSQGLNLQLYTDDNKWMFNSSNLHNSWFQFDCENIQDQVNNSIFADIFALPDDEISFKLFEDYFDEILSQSKANDGSKSEFFEKNKEKLELIKEKIVVEKSDNTKTINVNGKEENCTGYTVTISKEQVKEFFDLYFDYIENNEQIKEMFNANMQYQATLYGYGSNMSIEDAIKVIKENISIEDINMEVYIDSKGRATGIDVKSSIVSDDETINVDMTIEFKGNDNIGDDISFEIKFEDVKYNDVIKVNFDLVKTNENDTNSTKITGAITSGNEIIKIDGISNVNTSSKKIDAKLALSVDNEDITLYYDGTYDYDKSSKKFSLNLDEIGLKMNQYGMEDSMIFRVTYDVMPLTEEIAEPSGDKIDLFKMDDNQAMEVITEIQNNIMNSASSLMGY